MNNMRADNNKNILFFIMIAGVLFLTGCASMHEQERLDELDSVTEAYGMAIRWGKFASAMRLLDRSVMPDDAYIRAIGRIRISSYEVLQRELSEDGLEATQTVEIGYYYVDRLIEKKLIDKQIWRYEQDKKKWLLHSGLPRFE